MAELVLRRGHGAVRALECVENIVGPSGPSWSRWSSNGQSTDDYWALKAWALAELGRGDPHGRWSALAKAALGERSVWRV